MITIRPVNDTDIAGILDLLEPYVQEEIVLPRRPEEIRAEINCFYIALIDERPAAVVSYHDYNNKLYEIRSLVVHKDHARGGIGRRLVLHVIAILRNMEPDCRIFALTYVPGFFSKLGFSQIDKSLLPEKIWKDCSNCPNQDCCKEIPMIYPKSSPAF